MNRPIRVALIGNPNTGKTSVFNRLTGLSQKVGNYPGITVEKKIGVCRLPGGGVAEIIDLPGTYSLNTTSLDESVAVELLLNRKDPQFPDVIGLVSDVENIKRNLLLFTQLKDLRLPCILIINMADRMEAKGISIDAEELGEQLGAKVAMVSARKGMGLDRLKEQIEAYEELSTEPCMRITDLDPEYFERLSRIFPNEDPYKLWLVITQDVNFTQVEKKLQGLPENFELKKKEELKRLQQRETVLRYRFINEVLSRTYKKEPGNARGWSANLDRVLTHRIFGYLIFFVLLLTIFQVIFDWSQYPMDFIDAGFSDVAALIKEVLPPGVFTDLLAEGIVAGIGGIVIFIPQIAFLFLFISLLEESGYMSRVVFLMDRLMRPFGLSGKSIVPLISGMACAIPAVMATRTIQNWKERLITILVVPFTTCSARLPVYLIIIALVIPQGRIFGLGYQPLVLTGLYLLGFGSALLAAMLLHRRIRQTHQDFFMVEMPDYRVPQWRNVGITVFEKTRSFVVGAGKIILAISVILWFLGSNGFSEDFSRAEELVYQRVEESGLQPESEYFINEKLAEIDDAGEGQREQLRAELREKAVQQEVASYRLEHSIIGMFGKAIEPLVRPLGYDWKIGIALISSFAAREVFVGTLATIYSVGSDDPSTIQNRMAAERMPGGERPLFNLASGVSLLVFYAFAMQCMSTLAIVKKETNSWKWPLLQLVAMSVLAYVFALLAYQILIPYVR